MIIILILLIIASLIISIISFLEKGPIFSLPYYLSDKKTKENLKTKKRYYFIGSIFLLGTIILTIVLLQELSIIPSIRKVIIILSILLCIYSVIGYQRLESERMKN